MQPPRDCKSPLPMTLTMETSTCVALANDTRPCFVSSVFSVLPDKLTIPYPASGAPLSVPRFRGCIEAQGLRGPGPVAQGASALLGPWAFVPLEFKDGQQRSPTQPGPQQAR